VLIDIHDYDGVNPYHGQFYEAADWLFLSSVALPTRNDFALDRHGAGSGIVVTTHGADGATALIDGQFHSSPAPLVDEVVDTNGAGDAFACGFVDGWLGSGDPRRAFDAAAAQAGRAIASPGLAPSARPT
jgi:sugar/nucleoside kinase (ribokinase family)